MKSIVHTYLHHTLSETENERQKTKPVPILLLGTFPMSKQELIFFSIIGH